MSSELYRLYLTDTSPGEEVNIERCLQISASINYIIFIIILIIDILLESRERREGGVVMAGREGGGEVGNKQPTFYCWYEPTHTKKVNCYLGGRAGPATVSFVE